MSSGHAVRPFFWLHIRKAAGTSVLQALGPYYKNVNRFDPEPFVVLDKEYWNDNLNSYRVPLHKHSFKRTLFAQKFLYSEAEFREMYKFCVVRNPYDRAYSSWRYLTKTHGVNLNPKSSLRYISFSYFLDSIPEFWETFKSLHIATHTAPMWPDISDEGDANLLLDKVVYLESIDEGMSEVFENIGVSGGEIKQLNRTQKIPSSYSLSRRQKTKIELLYQMDFEKLYPNL